MFEAFSTRARRILFLARLEAGNSGATQMDVDHLLIALALEDQGDFDKVSRAMLNTDERSSKVQVSILSGVMRHTVCSNEGGEGQSCCPVWEPSVSREPFFNSDTASGLLREIRCFEPAAKPIPYSTDMPISTGLERILSRAGTIAKGLDDSEVTPLHLLAAALEGHGAAAETLHRTGITYDSVMEALRGYKR